MIRKLTLPALLFSSLLALAAAPAVSSGEALPEYRPALPTTGPLSLVNLIDTASLVKHGQGSATVFFSCLVDSIGDARGIEFYRGTPDSDKLGHEVLARCDKAHFSPAVFRHTPVAVLVEGTATLIVKDGKPHLRIFLNQSDEDLIKGQNFVAPQFVVTPGVSKFRTFYEPPQSSGHNGIGAAKLKVDATGHVTNSQVAYEYPPNMGFGAEVAGRVSEAAFIPGFRDGKIVPSEFVWALVFRRFGPSMPTG